MRDIFSDEFVIHWVIPGSYLLMLAHLFRALFRIHSSLRDHAASWECRRAQDDDLNSLYRMPAVSLAKGPPARVRQLAYALIVWAGANFALWSSIAAFASLFGVFWFLIILPFSLVASSHVTQCAFSLCDREDERVQVRLWRARIWIIAHHALAFVLSTLVYGVLFVVSYVFGNGSDWQTRHQGQILGAFLLTALLPALIAFLLLGALQSVKVLYPAGPHRKD